MASPDKRLLFGLVFAIVGLILAGAGAVEQLRTSGPDWATTTGRVLTSEVEEHHRRWRREAYERHEYVPRVTYAYEVGDRAFTGDRITAGIEADFFFDETSARDFVAAYPPGAEVAVLYDPEEPGTAALRVEPGAGGILIAMGGLCLVGGLVGAWRGIRRPVA